MKDKSEAEKAKALDKLKTEQLEAQIKEREAETKNLELLDRCVKAYAVSAMKMVQESTAPLESSELDGMHQTAKSEVKSMVRNEVIRCVFRIFFKSSIFGI